MSDQKTRDPNANEMKYPLDSEYAKHANSPAATGGRRASGLNPEAHELPPQIIPSEEAKHQWAGAKGPAQAGKP